MNNFLQDFIDLCKLSYSSFGNIERTLSPLGFTNIEMYETKSDLDCFLAKRGKSIYLVFRGTSEYDDVKTDIKFKKTEFESFKAHKGFVNSYNEIRSTVETYITNNFTTDDALNGGKIYFSGHSLGGALANLAAIGVAKQSLLNPFITLVTFGSPRVFGYNWKLQQLYKTIETFRVVNADDIVTKLPPAWSNYCHFGNEIPLSLKDKKNRIKEHSLSLYAESLENTIS